MTPARSFPSPCLRFVLSGLLVAVAGCTASTGDDPAAAAPTAVGAESAQAVPSPRFVALPNGEGGVRMDDLRWCPQLGRVVVPGGDTGLLDLIDPATGHVDLIAGFGAAGGGTTSADEGAGMLFAIDHGTQRVVVVDPVARTLGASAPLAAEPDYVRYSAGTHELWVTEPDEAQIEVFSLGSGGPPVPKLAATIAVPGGPEAIVIDATRGRVYTNLWKDATVVIDLGTRAILAHWPNGCTGGRGLALDEARGWLFVGCSEGRAAVLDLAHDGKLLGSASTGGGVDIIDYDPARGHLYVAGAKSATLTVLGVSAAGELSELATLPTAKGARAAITDRAGRIWVADPRGGQVLVFDDTAAPMPR